eukprot:11450953-Ditylum_brightwellii.AAC.1
MAEGLKKYIDRQEDCQSFFNDNRNPITDAQMVMQGQIHVAETGLFKKDYLEWIKQVQALKMWPLFKMFWNERFNDYELIQKFTSKEAGFGANAVEH